MDLPVFEEIRKHLEHLSTEGQQSVLEFARSLSRGLWAYRGAI